jgi:hypothetical protein
MRYKLPADTSACSVAGIQFTADANGFIDVPDGTAEEVHRELRETVGAKPFAPEHAEEMKAAELQREGLIAHLAQLGIPVDRRRRYSIEVLVGLRDDAIAAREEAAKATEDAAKANQAVESGDAPKTGEQDPAAGGGDASKAGEQAPGAADGDAPKTGEQAPGTTRPARPPRGGGAK